MEEKAKKNYKIYEYIRDNKQITEEISGTKKIINNLIKDDEETIKYCNRKIEEERQEIEEAKYGEHFHKNMTKREILVNEISQYLYWKTIVAVAKNYSYEQFNYTRELNEILKGIDVRNIKEEKPITLNEVVENDLRQMAKKDYLKDVI